MKQKNRGIYFAWGQKCAKARCWEKFEEGKEICCGKDLAQIKSILKRSVKEVDSYHQPTFQLVRHCDLLFFF